MNRTLLLSALTGIVGCAHQRPVATPPSLAPDLANLAFYVGNWQCAGTAYDATGKVTQTVPKIEVHVAPAVDHWLAIEGYENGAHMSSELKGIDPAGHYHQIWTASDGSYGSLSASGWTGNQLVFDPDKAEGDTKWRTVFTKIDATHYTHRMDADSGTGYHREFEKSCHKV